MNIYPDFDNDYKISEFISLDKRKELLLNKVIKGVYLSTKVQKEKQR